MALLYVKPCLLGKIVCVWLNLRLGVFRSVFLILALEFDVNVEFVNTISCAMPMLARNDWHFRHALLTRLVAWFLLIPPPVCFNQFS
jgi:hypothetical protein